MSQAPQSGQPVFQDAWVSRLSNRSILSVRGRDAVNLLQNVATTDMKVFETEGQERAAAYTGFLNVKGKIMFDGIIVKPRLASQTADDMEFWIDIHEDDFEPLKKHLRRYAMRKNIRIDDLSHVIKAFSIQSLVGVPDTQPEGHFFKLLQDEVEMFESDEFPGSFETDVAAFVDPRTHSNGVRVLCADESFEVDDGVKIIDDCKEYDVTRMMLGLSEGSKEIGNIFPLNMHLHYLNGVSFSKGCYIGQELTQRTYHTGVIRRIALPFAMIPDNSIKLDTEHFSPYSKIDRSFDIPMQGEVITDSNGKKLGKVLTNQFNMGTALVDLNKLNDNGPNHIYKLSDYRVLLWQPLWLNMQLEQKPIDSDSGEEIEVESEQGEIAPDQQEK